jgi:hypothetical protein
VTEMPGLDLATLEMIERVVQRVCVERGFEPEDLNISGTLRHAVTRMYQAGVRDELVLVALALARNLIGKTRRTPTASQTECLSRKI